jgi:hypothetical protein
LVKLTTGLLELQAALDGWDTAASVKEQAVYMRDTVLPALEKAVSRWRHQKL